MIGFRRMILQTIDDAANYLKKGRMFGEKPVLFLGAGASVAAGVKPMRELMPAAFKCSTFEEFCAKIGPLTESERFRYLFEYLQNDQQDPFHVTDGFRALGRLIRDMYFDLILTTNFDPLLEDALVAAEMRRKHYLLLINPVVQQRWYDPLLSDPLPRVKVVKLHGDLFHRVMAWTPDEMDKYLAPLGARLEDAISGKDMMVVGHGLADSPRIQKLAKKVLAKGRALWFVNVATPPEPFASDPHVRAVTGDFGKFETFFASVADLLDERAPATTPAAAGRPAARKARAARPRPQAREAMETREAPGSLDDLMEAVVGVVAADNAAAGGTGFLLRQPRVIITDGYFAGSSGMKDRATVITADGRRFTAKVLSWFRKYPFGPVVLEAPKELAARGFELREEAPSTNLPVKVGVAAGRRVGVSSGHVRNPKEQSIQIAQFPDKVGNLVQLECAVAPGSCGAPVVDDQFGVFGYIVAGSPDVDNPTSYMYPSGRWAPQLKRKAP
jgi:S1-C subfamily serine protease